MDATYQLALDEAKKYQIEADFLQEPSLPSFEIRRTGGHLAIAAPNSLEMLYGVYDCAERFGGYTFFEPGRDLFEPSQRVEVCAPGLPDATLVPARRPLLKHRGFIQEFPFNAETPALFDWMAKNKLNYLLVWIKYYDELSEDLKQEAAVRGIVFESGHHTFDYWIPGKIYGKTHPEFFAEKNGKRVAPTGDEAILMSKQLCTTNPQVRAEIARRMAEYAEAHPEVKIVSLWPNDGFGWCECENCSKFYDKNEKGTLYNLSEHVYKADRIYHDMVRDVCARVNRAHPDLQITLVAYINYCAPSPGFTLQPNMAVDFATYWRCINHELTDSNCPINPHYADDIRQWVAVKRGGDVNVCDYYMGVNFYLSLPMIHFHEMFHEMKWYGETGVDGIMTQFHIPHWTSYGLNFYLMGKAARGEAEKETIEGIMRRLFGTDAALAKAFYGNIKKLLLTMGKCHIPYPYSLFRRTTLADYQELLAQAREIAARKPSDRFRQELVIWMDYICRFKAFFDKVQSQKATVEDAENLLAWVHSHRDTRVFVHDRFDTYFEAIEEDIRTNRPWYHFNIDWEDEYVRRHVELLK